MGTEKKNCKLFGDLGDVEPNEDDAAQTTDADEAADEESDVADDDIDFSAAVLFADDFPAAPAVVQPISIAEAECDNGMDALICFRCRQWIAVVSPCPSPFCWQLVCLRNGPRQRLCLKSSPSAVMVFLVAK